MSLDIPAKKRKFVEDIPTPEQELAAFKFDGVELGRNSPPEVIDLLLAHTWEEGKTDPTGWWMSEKLDGVRCYWNGETFLSRNGKRYDVPAFFVEGLPKTVSLDGELWVGRKQFSKTVSIVKKKEHVKDFDPTKWNDIKFLLFDAPSITQPFEYRLAYLQYLQKTLGKDHIIAHKHFKCKSSAELQQMCKSIDEVGGEGMMIRQPKSLYEHKRSRTLQKVKLFKDAEALVVGYEPGKGKHVGVMGALRVENCKDGVKFKLGTGFNDEDRRSPPPIGSTVTYKYQELTDAGVPRFPIFLRVHPGI